MNGVVPQANGDSSKVKVKVRVNINGMFNVSGATITEKVESAPTVTEEPEPMDVDNNGEKPTQDAASEATDSKQQPAADEGTGDSPKDSTSTNDVADIELANKDAADKVHDDSYLSENCKDMNSFLSLPFYFKICALPTRGVQKVL